MEIFRFEVQDLKFFFSRILKKKLSGKLYFINFFFLLKEVKPSPDLRKVIKLLTLDNVFPSLRHFGYEP